MKILCDRETLLGAFGAVGGVVPARSPKPVLQNVKLVVDVDAGATLMASDLEVGIRLGVLGVKVDRAGSAILPFGRVGQILRSCAGDAELAIEAEGNTLEVRGLRSTFKLPCEDPDLFPDPPEFAGAGNLIDGDELRRAIRRVVFCTDPDSTRYALSGVLFEFDADDPTVLRLVATDGRRLAMQPVAVEPEAGALASRPNGSPVVPAKALRLIEKNLDGETPAAINIGEAGGGALLVRSGRAVIWSRLVEGRFPNYTAVIPARFDHRVEFGEVGPLLGAVEQARVTTSKESRGIDFEFSPDGLVRLGSMTADVGESRVEVPVEFGGTSPLALTMDGSYVAEMLRAMDPGQPFAVELIDPKSAVVLRTADDYTAVVMPLSRG